jgi:hypothetical protein
VTYRRRVAKVKTQETAWRLVEYLHGQLPGMVFMVALPKPDWVEVWPAPGSPLMPSDWLEVDTLVDRFKELRGSPSDGDPRVTKVS